MMLEPSDYEFRRRNVGESCAECGTFTNHSTEQHAQVQEEMSKCSMCGEVKDHDDDEQPRCLICNDEYWQWRMEVYYDNLAKAKGDD